MKKEKHFVCYDAESDRIFLSDGCHSCNFHLWLYPAISIYFLGEL